jgi:hypothetical protein
MMENGFRFDPPEFELATDTVWVLARAFGPMDVPFGERVDSSRAIDVSERLGLTARIGARIPAGRLLAEVGEMAVATFTKAYADAAALDLAAAGLCRQLAILGETLRLPVIVLKGAALRESGVTPRGSRQACDVDVLTLESRLDDLHGALVSEGYRVSGMRGAEHELEALYHPSGLMVEVHRYLRGVRISEERIATADHLLDYGLCRGSDNDAVGLLVPEPHVLLAHLLVHGIAQHGHAPWSYPLLRLVGDVQDMGLDSDGWSGFLDRGWRWIAGDVSRREATAVWELGRRLATGEAPQSIIDGREPAGLILSHMVEGTLDDEYQRSLRLHHLMHPVAGTSTRRTILRKVTTNVWLRRGEIDQIYGPQPNAARYLAMRLWRPVDLALQAVGSFRARSAVKKRRRK